MLLSKHIYESILPANLTKLIDERTDSGKKAQGVQPPVWQETYRVVALTREPAECDRPLAADACPN